MISSPERLTGSQNQNAIVEIEGKMITLPRQGHFTAPNGVSVPVYTPTPSPIDRFPPGTTPSSLMPRLEAAPDYDGQPEEYDTQENYSAQDNYGAQENYGAKPNNYGAQENYGAKQNNHGARESHGAKQSNHGARDSHGAKQKNYRGS
jgi:hypothetical protein